MTAWRGLPRWPLVPIAAPAAVAIWSGWVGLGGMCGFGLVQPFPGIVPWHLDTAITLPVGVETYGAYALGAWLTPGTPDRARTFARRSAVGALMLGMAGQVIYHLLAAAHAPRAPWPVVVVVSCMPVVTLGFGAALTHLLRVPVPGETAQGAQAGQAPGDPESDAVSPPVPGDAETAAMASLRATLTAGNPWSLNQLSSRFSLTRAQATRVRDRVLAESNGHAPDNPGNAGQ
jgi:hypothetical protein